MLHLVGQLNDMMQLVDKNNYLIIITIKLTPRWLKVKKDFY